MTDDIRAKVLKLNPAQTVHYRDVAELAGFVDQLIINNGESRHQSANYREGFMAALDVVRFELAERLRCIEMGN